MILLTSALNCLISSNKILLRYSHFNTLSSDQLYKKAFFSSNSWAKILYDNKLKSEDLCFAKIKMYRHVTIFYN